MKTEAERVLERVRRLLALSKSSNVHEAAAAAAKAQELMSRYQLDAAELEVAEGHEPEPVLDGELEQYGSRREPWREILAGALAKANGCAIHTRNRKMARSGKVVGHVVNVVGASGSTALVRYMHAYLVREVGRLCRKHAAACKALEGIDGVPVAITAAWRNSFRLGAASMLSSRIEDAARAARKASSATGTALARVDDAGAGAKAYVDELLRAAGRTGARVAKHAHSAAYVAGARAAQGVTLSTDAPALGAGAAANLGAGT